MKFVLFLRESTFDNSIWYKMVTYILLLLLFFNQKCLSIDVTSEDRLALREKSLEMFNHAYKAYMENAYPADELMPIACKGRVRGITPPRGDIDDALGNFSLTLVDTLDTLAVLGLYDEFENAVKKVEQDVSFDNDVSVSVFETNIRMLGGLLGGHSAALELQQAHGRMPWYNGSLLALAKDLGDRLLPAFNTTSGIPLSRINLLTGAVRKDRETCTACAGTMILEMAALSRFTGDPIYEARARKAMDYLWSRRQRSSDLMGTVLNVENGQWIRKESGIGAGIDSYYEYLFKAYVLLGDEAFLERFNTHYQAIEQYCTQGSLMVDVLMHKPTVSARSFVDALSAFWPGLQVLKGDVKSAIQTHELLYQVFTLHTFLPEAFTTNFDIHWGHYPLRPEFAESTYLLYKATGDPYYIEVGKTILENLETKARVPCGFAGIKDVRTFKHEDRMDSYFLAEMFKYLYLLFTPDHLQPGLNIENYILTTEAHVLPLHLSLRSNFKNNYSFEEVASPVNAPDNFERLCATSEYVRGGDLKKIETLRKENSIANERSASEFCASHHDRATISRRGAPKLTAAEFTPENKQHLRILNRMGIKIVVLGDGDMQLVQQHNRAHSALYAMEGALFLQEITKMSDNQAKASIEPVHVQLLSPPYVGALAFRASSAQFRPSLKSLGEVAGEVAIAHPFDACSPLVNAHDVKGKIVLTQRGQCMFVAKTKTVEMAGGIAAIIIDNQQSSFETSAPFQMAGDVNTETSIPAFFLFGLEGSALRDATLRLREKQKHLRLLLSNKLKPLNELLLKNQIADEVEKMKEHSGLTSTKDADAHSRTNREQEAASDRFDLNMNKKNSFNDNENEL